MKVLSMKIQIFQKIHFLKIQENQQKDKLTFNEQKIINFFSKFLLLEFYIKYNLYFIF